MNVSTFFNYPTEPPIGVQLPLAFWSTRSPRDWRKLLSLMQTLRFRAGETVTRGNGFYVVGFGRFRTPTTTYEEGHALNIATFFSGQPSRTPLTAQVDGELLYLNRDAFEIFAAREPDLARAVLFELGRILAATQSA